MANRIRKLTVAATLLSGLAFVAPAMADGHGGGGGWHGGGHGGGYNGGHGGGHGNGWGWGLFGLGLGLALTAPYYPPTYYQPTYYPPAYYPQQQVLVQAPTYVEQAAPVYVQPPPSPEYATQAPASEGSNWWYHCRRPEGYYPYVRTCPSGWERVSPTPPG